jgi:hypothetical protein
VEISMESRPANGNGWGPDGAFDYAALAGKPATTRESQRIIRRWLKGRLSQEQVEERIRRGLHLGRVRL